MQASKVCPLCHGEDGAHGVWMGAPCPQYARIQWPQEFDNEAFRQDAEINYLDWLYTWDGKF